MLYDVSGKSRADPSSGSPQTGGLPQLPPVPQPDSHTGRAAAHSSLLEVLGPDSQDGMVFERERSAGCPSPSAYICLSVYFSRLNRDFLFLVLVITLLVQAAVELYDGEEGLSSLLV